MEVRVRSAHERREELLAKAAAMGIDEAYISHLVESFYARVRVHPELGPIFERAIGDGWDHHLAKLKSFWASVALNAGTYSGKPVPAHMKLDALTRAHFTTWLGLFEETLEETAPSPAVVPYFMERANRIAQSLQLAIFDMPGMSEQTVPRSEGGNGA